MGRGRVMAYDVPVTCGEVLVRPGELVFADFDGIVVVKTMVGVPVIAGAAGVRMAEQSRGGWLLVDVEQLKTDVGMLCVCDHALAGTIDGRDEFQLARFECAHAIMLALEGIPAVYIHSVLGTPNDYEGLARTGRYRSINRRSWSREALEAALKDSSSLQAQAFQSLTSLLKLRRKQKAFHPNAIQFTMQLGLETFGIWRQSIDRDQDIFCVSNVTREPRDVELENINLVSTERWADLISGDAIEEGQSTLRLKPYQTVWLANR